MKKKKLSELTDDELRDAWVKGTNWLAKKMQVSGTDRNEAGQKYNHEQFERGLKRIELIERVMQKRGIVYG